MVPGVVLLAVAAALVAFVDDEAAAVVEAAPPPSPPAPAVRCALFCKCFGNNCGTKLDCIDNSKRSGSGEGRGSRKNTILLKF